MLLSLNIEQSFAHKNASFNFQKGLTSISGLNGTGKSELLEVIQWLLFGTKALRGEVNHKAELSFEVKGAVYTVARSKTKVLLSDKNGNPIASGLKPVNAKIIEILGYGFEVFTVANAVNQGKIEQLGAMLPSERKRLVDETIGLSKLDAISKWAMEQAAECAGEMKAHEKYLQPPVAVGEKPYPDLTLALLQETWVSKNSLFLKLKDLRTQTEKKPEKVHPHPQTEQLEELKAQMAQRSEGLGALRALDQAMGSFEVVMPANPPLPPKDLEMLPIWRKQLSEKLQAAAQMSHLRRQLSQIPFTAHTMESLDEALAACRLAVRVSQKQKLLESLVEYKCPACNHEWHDADPRLADYEGVPDVAPIPPMSEREIDANRNLVLQQGQRADIDKALQEARRIYESLPEISETQIEAVELAEKNYQTFLRKKEKHEQWLKLKAEYDSLNSQLPADVSALVREIEKNISVLQAYSQAFKVWEALYQKREKLEALDLEKEVLTLQKMYEERQAWESSFAQYSRDLAAHLEHKDAHATAQARAEAWRSVRDAIVQMKARVKTHLLPSLNKTASILVSNFSGGWLTKVHVDEEFEITVDGKKLHTLSGAGKAFSNLAVRIGLGLVLTNGVFSVLLLDEIDAGVDTEKAPLLAKALQGLTNQIQQILYVSHKPNLVSDHAITL